MKYKTKFTVVYSGKTGKILYEIWEPLRRLCWPFPWRKLPGEPQFKNYEDLEKWFEKNYPEKRLRYDYYGYEKCDNNS